MTKTMRILLGLFIITLWACSNTTPQQNESIIDRYSDLDYTSNLPSLMGKYETDTSGIIKQNNLQQFIKDLEKSELEDKNSVIEIPTFIKSFLDSLNGGFTIANPGEDWQAGCTSLIIVDAEGNIISDEKPKNQLIYFGLNSDIALMAYYRGGIGKSEQILIFKLKDNKIVDFWNDYTLTDVKNKAEIINYLKANKE